MAERELLTENDVIQGVENFLREKGRTSNKTLKRKSNAEKKERGVDLEIKLENDARRGNRYYIEAKGNRRVDGTAMRSTWSTNFRWALSQLILRIKVDSTKYNYIYGIAVPKSDIDKCIKLVRNNWALKHLKIRLYGAYCENGELTAKEYLPKEIYD